MSKLPKNFRAIDLCNLSYKLIAKILGGRLNKFLHKLFFEEQGVFVPSRNISNIILLV